MQNRERREKDDQCYDGDDGRKSQNKGAKIHAKSSLCLL